MNFDLRFPIGALFSFYGLLLMAYGAMSNKEIYQKSLDINVNLRWGFVMLVFGAIMLWLAVRGRRRTR